MAINASCRTTGFAPFRPRYGVVVDIQEIVEVLLVPCHGHSIDLNCDFTSPPQDASLGAEAFDTVATLLLDEIVTGMGDFDIGNFQVAYMFVRTLATGDDVHRLTPAADLDRYARLGFVAFGSEQDLDDDGPRTYWRAPIWIEFLNFEWTPIPQYFGGDFTIWVSKVRYSFAPGAEAHIWVYGF